MNNKIASSLLLVFLVAFGCNNNDGIEKRNKEIVKQYLDELIINGDFTNSERLIASDMTFYANGEEIPEKGLDFIKNLIEEEKASFSRNELVEIETIADGNTVAARWYVKGIHDKGDYQGTPSRNKEFKYDGMSFYKIENGLIVEAYILADMLSFMSQIGAIELE